MLADIEGGAWPYLIPPSIRFVASTPVNRDRVGPMTEEATRLEHDSMGEVAVPASAKWGATTQRAVENFPISGQRMDPAVIHALGRIKAAAASVNAQLGVLEADAAAAIRRGRR